MACYKCVCSTRSSKFTDLGRNICTGGHFQEVALKQQTKNLLSFDSHDTLVSLLLCNNSLGSQQLPVNKPSYKKKNLLMVPSLLEPGDYKTTNCVWVHIFLIDRNKQVTNGCQLKEKSRKFNSKETDGLQNH